LGKEANPSEARKGKRRVVEELVDDLDPATKEVGTEVHQNRMGEESEEELRKILGKSRTSQR
jgi:hypothetical protein